LWRFCARVRVAGQEDREEEKQEVKGEETEAGSHENDEI